MNLSLYLNGSVFESQINKTEAGIKTDKDDSIFNMNKLMYFVDDYERKECESFKKECETRAR